MLDRDFFGLPSRMVPVDWVTRLSIADSSAYAFKTAKSKRWAFVTSRSDGTLLREWDVEVSSYHQGASVLQEFLYGGWGHGPFHWVPMSSHQTNMLTPSQSLMVSLPSSTGMQGTDGWSPRSVTGPTQRILADGVPVIPEESVTASLDTEGTGAILRIDFLSASNAVLSSKTVQADANGYMLQRLSLSAEVPVMARMIRLSVSGHIRASRPQVTWTDHPVPYIMGSGASSVVISTSGRTPEMLLGCDEGSVWTSTIQMVEVG